MVKGVSRQVIVVHSPDPKLFDQAIFILKDEAAGRAEVTDEALLKEAKRLIHGNTEARKRGIRLCGPLWAGIGAFLTGVVWFLTWLL